MHSPFMWYQRLMRFYSGPRPAETPFFMAKDRVRPYTYAAGLKDLQVMLWSRWLIGGSSNYTNGSLVSATSQDHRSSPNKTQDPES
jgi:hypothetical protein